MQPNNSREMQGVTSSFLLNQQESKMYLQDQQTANGLHFHPTSFDDDLLEQMYSSIGSSSSSSSSFCSLYSDVMGTGNPKLPPWDFDRAVDEFIPENVQQLQFHDQSVLLSTKLRQHQINDAAADTATGANSLLLRQQLPMQSRCVGGNGLTSTPIGGDDSLIYLPPLSLGGSNVISAHHYPNGNVSVQSLYNGFDGSLFSSGQISNQFHQPEISNQFHRPQITNQFHQPQAPDFEAATAAAAAVMNATASNVMNAAAPSSSSAGGGNPGQPRQRVRAKRGQATDPHSIAERLRRERISERMKALQELVPNGSKSDKASKLDEVVDYVKFLQLQVKLLSMSRLGGAIVADIPSEGRGGGSSNNGGGQYGGPSSSSINNNNDSVTLTENQVAKLMEEDMGSAMQYLQGKGLCLMPLSLATAISTATSRNPLALPPSIPLPPSNGGAGPSMSVLTAQSGQERRVYHGNRLDPRS